MGVAIVAEAPCRLQIMPGGANVVFCIVGFAEIVPIEWSIGGEVAGLLCSVVNHCHVVAIDSESDSARGLVGCDFPDTLKIRVGG